MTPRHIPDDEHRDRPVTKPVHPLFTDVLTSEALDRQRQKLAAALDGLSDDALLSRDLDELVTEQLDTFHIEPVTIDWAAAATGAGTVACPPLDRAPLTTPAPGSDPPGRHIKLSIEVPFVGAPGLFGFRPSASTGDPALGFVASDPPRLILVAVAPDLASAVADLERQEATIAALVSAVNKEVEGFDAALPGEIRQVLSARIGLLTGDASLSDALAVPYARAGGTGSAKGGGRGPSQAARGSRIDPPRPRGRPGWTAPRFQTAWRKAVAATPPPWTYARLAPNFQALDGQVGVSPEHLRHLRSTFRHTEE